MILELAIALLLGILAGTITGLLPGIHINLVSAIIVSSIAFIPFSPIIVVTFIVAMAIAHTFLDFIPSIYLGAPEEDTFLAVLPGHELLKEGKGHEAITIALLGSVSALGAILILTPIAIYSLPAIEKILLPTIPFILVFVSSYMILREEKHFLAFVVFLLAGFLGILTFNLPIKEPLLPLLTGLFGASSIILSLKNENKITEQTITPIKHISLTKQDIKKAFVGAAISTPFCSFLPALGSGYAALISSEIVPQTRRGFLLLNGMLNTIIMGLSFVVLYTLNKSRTGAAAATKSLLEQISITDLSTILVVIAISGVISFFLGISLSILSAKLINKINYKILSLVVLLVIISSVLIFSNPLGALTFVAGTAIGIFAIESGIRRTNLMGCLLIPTILIYLLN